MIEHASQDIRPDRKTNPYLLSNAAEQADDRFSALSALFNPVTFGHLDRLGIDAGWRCWEVGAGGPSVAAWMAERVGPAGRVVATDIDTSHLPHDLVGVEVQRHDVAADQPPSGGFDLIHIRLVLTHVPARDEALHRMGAALAPGGWLVVEDFDPALLPAACVEVTTQAQQRANKIRRGFLDLLAGRGVDLYFGRKLPRLLREQGLVNVSADAYFPVTTAPARVLEAANTAQVAAALVAGEHATQDEIDGHLAALRAGELDITTPPLISAWGRAPHDETWGGAPRTNAEGTRT